MGVEVGFMTCGVREARDSFSKLRRRAARGEEILIIPDTAAKEDGAVSLVATWFIDALVGRTTDWTISRISQPGAPIAQWS